MLMYVNQEGGYAEMQPANDELVLDRRVSDYIKARPITPCFERHADFSTSNGGYAEKFQPIDDLTAADYQADLAVQKAAYVKKIAAQLG